MCFVTMQISITFHNQAGAGGDVCVFVYFRRLQIEEMEARIALMPLLQAEHDRRWTNLKE